MSERKVLQKYYPPEWDPNSIARRRGPKASGPRVQTVRIMSPFSMRCLTCGEYIYKGRKFNSRKETPVDQNAEIRFRTDPKNSDYAMVSGAVRNNEPWRNRATEAETDEERLNRLEREEADAAGEEEKDAMADLEAKNADAQREMAAADALDEIRQRNARINRSEKEGIDFADSIIRSEDEERERQEREDDEAAKRAFAAARAQLDTVIEDHSAEQAAESSAGPSTEASAAVVATPEPEAAAPSFKRVVKKKKNHSALLGIKKKPSLV
ncbi:hypothetical protein CEP54_013609 [Fusarium duplospermum]|uniref:Splicing factor YJU2 n=1 Tax=Fusarium duplospermum TaxID=1325734 RepID=A0A428P1V8_9HYPO|nr:hypothetical protein CEP54_013609 [Fusarium duplospermum]